MNKDNEGGLFDASVKMLKLQQDHHVDLSKLRKANEENTWEKSTAIIDEIG